MKTQITHPLTKLWSALVLLTVLSAWLGSSGSARAQYGQVLRTGGLTGGKQATTLAGVPPGQYVLEATAGRQRLSRRLDIR
ncbi:hypothetical protein EJV47_19425 [Hymenobacter gummosus]|uniref:Carboxypeptidase regulatory-like domain-containing protein n=1 Tax=Hymenobacter gummosus TaxID=1776032 RepID=A0A3S0JCD8_9BACT|nr:hypothetical protein [Hymenobacter gummosus]RTQ47587.1 hypothetical protein EJV47_19425 [Hymenobacter gummosus]